MESDSIREYPVPEPVKKKKVNKFLVIAAVAVVLLLITGWLQLGNGLLNRLQGRFNTGDELRYLVPIKEFQVNSADIGSRRFIRMKIYLGSNDKALVKEIERREPELRSRVIATLRSTKVADLEGEEGMERLKKVILEEANALLSTGDVEDLFFDEFIIQ